MTEAERFGWSFVFAGLLPDDFAPTRGVVQAPWWRQVEGADWRRPEGAQSDLDAEILWRWRRPTAPCGSGLAPVKPVRETYRDRP